MQLLFDYVRVHQRKGCTNIGCDPSADYINAHLEVYTSEWRVLSQVMGC